VNLRKYLVLAGVTLFAAIGDTLLSRGMRGMDHISLHHLSSMFLVVLHPGLALGIAFLLAFFACYLTALSWADLTYVLPATSLSYVLVTIMGKLVLHETVSPGRWLGVLLISSGVGFVTRGPANTPKPKPHAAPVDARVTDVALSEVRQ
jgi:drug/metabolite transporter (DMT)-like permease